MNPIDAYFSGPTYEQLLGGDARWALSEGGRHFDESNAVFRTLQKLAQRLEELGVGYCVVGGLALFRHGFRRFTEDVDVLVTKQDLQLIHEELEVLGYLPPFEKSKHLRVVETRVRVEFLVTGGFPGDGKPKPVAFPDPRDVAQEIDGVRYIQLPKLVELKLASGMSNVNRMKDLTDVMELIKAAALPLDLAESLDPFVRDEYRRLWQASQRRYVTYWSRERMAVDRATLDEMLAAGVTIEPGRESADRVKLVTTDPRTAEKYDFVDEFYASDED